jgi:murein L,D-transpeptidase YafK
MKRVVAAAACLLTAAVLTWANVPPRPADPGTPDAVRIEKSARRLVLLRDSRAVKTYRVALGRAPSGAKEREGDLKTPEGRYVIDFHKWDSGYHRALHVSYPNADDRARAQREDLDPGGDIMIHGLRNGLGWIGRLHRGVDWTRGCIAVTNPEIEEIYGAVQDGTPVEIVP